MFEFEMGPIRPPSEAYSILLRVTRNCPWNKCAFCPVYKGEKFSLRTVEEIKADIDSMFAIAEKVYSKIQYTDYKITPEIISSLLAEGISHYHLQQMIFWMHYGMKSLFLQDADAMVMKPKDLVEVLNYIRFRFPSIERITCYSRSKTLVSKSISDLKEIREAGLDRIHVGMESGSDDVLKLINKGVKAHEQIIAGQNVLSAGFELSEYYMPGIGGKALSEKNATETARVLNEINPSFIRIRTTTPVPGTPLADMMNRGEWIPLTEKEKVEEIRSMISLLDNITSYIQSDHVMNLIEDASGKMPDDKEFILSHFDKFLAMSEEDQECFIVARRTGSVRFLADYRKTSQIENMRDRLLKMYGSIDKASIELSSAFL